MFLTYLGATVGPQRLPGLDGAARPLGVLRRGQAVPRVHLPNARKAESSLEPSGASFERLGELLILYSEAERGDDSLQIRPYLPELRGLASQGRRWLGAPDQVCQATLA